jgi:hypothetical protein
MAAKVARAPRATPQAPTVEPFGLFPAGARRAAAEESERLARFFSLPLASVR